MYIVNWIHERYKWFHELDLNLTFKLKFLLTQFHSKLFQRVLQTVSLNFYRVFCIIILHEYDILIDHSFVWRSKSTSAFFIEPKSALIMKG